MSKPAHLLYDNNEFDYSEYEEIYPNVEKKLKQPKTLQLIAAQHLWIILEQNYIDKHGGWDWENKAIHPMIRTLFHERHLSLAVCKFVGGPAWKPNESK